MKAVTVILAIAVVVANIVIFSFLPLSTQQHVGGADSHAILKLTGPIRSSSSSLSCYGLDQIAVGKVSKLKVALIKPIFTTTAYSSDGFYRFYTAHSNKERTGINVTSDLSSLNITLVNGWGTSWTLHSFMSSSQASVCGLVAGRNLQVLTDIDVSEGALFYKENGSRMFDSVVLGFNEYVTNAEYSAYKTFVASGGTLVMIDSTNFIASVQYYPGSNHLALVSGHGWVFNGKTAWRYPPYANWKTENANWVGGNACCFESAYSKERNTTISAIANTTNPISVALRERFGERVFGLYHPHEEDAVTNSSDSIIARFPPIRGQTIAAYEHPYKAGRVINLGIFGTDIILEDPTVQYFLISSLL